MNKPQKLIVTLAIIVIVGMGLFPPWVRTDASDTVRHRRYSFILLPPRSTADALQVNSPVRYSLDWVYLVKGWLCVAGLAVPLAVLLRTRRKQ